MSGSSGRFSLGVCTTSGAVRELSAGLHGVGDLQCDRPRDPRLPVAHMSVDSSTPSGPSGVWSVIVDYLADDYEQAIVRRGLIETAVDETGLPASVSTVAQVAPLVQMPEEDE